MDLSWVIYFAGIADNLNKFFVVGGAFVIFGAFMYWGPICEGKKEGEKAAKVLIPVAALMILIGAIIPDKTTIYLMAGTKVAEQIVTSPEVKQINGKILTIINQKLDSLVDDKKK